MLRHDFLYIVNAFKVFDVNDLIDFVGVYPLENKRLSISCTLFCEDANTATPLPAKVIFAVDAKQ